MFWAPGQGASVAWTGRRKGLEAQVVVGQHLRGALTELAPFGHSLPFPFNATVCPGAKNLEVFLSAALSDLRKSRDVTLRL